MFKLTLPVKKLYFMNIQIGKNLYNKIQHWNKTYFTCILENSPLKNNNSPLEKTLFMNFTVKKLYLINFAIGGILQILPLEIKDFINFSSKESVFYELYYWRKCIFQISLFKKMHFKSYSFTY